MVFWYFSCDGTEGRPLSKKKWIRRIVNDIKVAQVRFVRLYGGQVVKFSLIFMNTFILTTF